VYKYQSAFCAGYGKVILTYCIFSRRLAWTIHVLWQGATVHSLVAVKPSGDENILFSDHGICNILDNQISWDLMIRKYLDAFRRT